MGQFEALAALRWRSLRNRARGLRSDGLAKLSFVALGLCGVSSVAYGVAFWCFRFIEGIPAFGAPLNERLLALFFLILLVMVGLSTAIISYSTLFLAAETEYLFQNPAQPRFIFFLKLAESVGFSAWATMVVGLPVLAAFGHVRRAPLVYYLEAAAAMGVFLIFCGFAGAGLTFILLEVVRRWSARRVIAAAAVLVGLPAWLFLRSFDFAGLNGRDNLQVLDRFVAGLTTLKSPFFPGQWVASLVVSASTGHHSEALFQGCVLLANTLIFLPLFAAYSRSRYSFSWLRSRDPFASRRASKRASKRAAAAAARLAPAAPSAPAAAPVPSPPVASPRRPPRGNAFPIGGPTASLFFKDLLTFVRDPAQISQFLLFLLLLAVYIASLLQIPRDAFTENWRKAIYFSNLGAISLILSSFTSRFLFPLISLEGKSFWIVGLAPIERAFLVRQKALLGAAVILTLGFLAAILSNVFLGFGGGQLLGALYTVALAGICLTSLASGLGAAYPSVGEDNPARIAVGLGGTLNFFASGAAVLILLAVESLPYILPWPGPEEGVPLAHLVALLFTIVVSWTALRIGQRSLLNMES